jgi:membrane-bound lytic murein transglycosylase D
MNSTAARRAPKARSRPFAGIAAALLLAISALAGSTGAYAADDPMPRPPQLERDVQFWIRVYSQIDTNSGFLHDQYNLGVVYDTLHFAPNTPPAERQRQVDEARERYGAALRRIAAAGDGTLTADDQHIKDLWGAEGTPARLHSAVDDIRFQLGQADRFRAGLIRSGAWETHIAETLANLGLPPELAVLPHVESSFDPNAYSKVGAAGLWQFMRSTGRRYMRIDGAVDDRLDPFRSTEAAAQLLSYNYRVLGTWPLALTAYNHGTAGMRRATETMGTDDIVKIVRGYGGRTFGFASRNFYVSFLAALDIDRNPEKYFGPLPKDSEAHFQEVSLPAYVPAASLERALKIDAAKLRALNPALLPSVWNGAQRVPKAYHLRLPAGDSAWSTQTLAARLTPAEMFAGQRGPQRYRVQSGDTLATLADRYGVPIEQLARLNRLRTSAHLKPGHTISVPETTTVTLAAATAPAPEQVSAPPQHTAAPAPAAVVASIAPPSPGGAVSPDVALRESAEDAAAIEEVVIESTRPPHEATPNSQPVSAAQAEALGPALGPAAESEQNADPFDYSVAQDGTIRVAAEETLGHYADWLGLSSARLREINHLKLHTPVRIGQRIRLDFSQVTREVFATLRHEYHREQQASYFAAHRIVGTEVHIARSGDSAWTLTRHESQLPVWLLQQYNPDLDLSALRAGTQIVVPRVEEVGSGG